MKEHDVVRVVKLLQENRYYDGTESIKRSPQIGDTSTIVFLQDNFCIVECVDSEGYTIWVADFLVEELEICER
jgi:hypothetical protein